MSNAGTQPKINNGIFAVLWEIIGGKNESQIEDGSIKLEGATPELMAEFKEVNRRLKHLETRHSGIPNLKVVKQTQKIKSTKMEEKRKNIKEDEKVKENELDEPERYR